MTSERTRQLAFRLPHGLIERIDSCEEQARETGLNLSRTDVVRLLLTYALNKSEANFTELLSPPRPSRAKTDGAKPKPDSVKTKARPRT